MWVKTQHQMEVLNPVYLTPNMIALTKMTKRQKLWIFILLSLMKHDGLIEYFHLQNETWVNGVKDMSQKIIRKHP